MLRTLLESGAAVRGLRALHAKLYVFGDSVAIVTSANLTVSGLDSNPEFGLVTEDPAAIRSCLDHFEALWHRARDDLRIDQVEQWTGELDRHLASGAGRAGTRSLPDYGVDAGLPEPSRTLVSSRFSEAEHAIVKFHGEGHDRAPLSNSTLEELEGSGCHWAVCYPRNRRPRSLQDGTIVFIACLTEESGRSRIFGRAVGTAYVDERDDATPADIQRRSWKAAYPHYIRVDDAEFVAGTLENGVSLEDMMQALGTDSFVTTQQRAQAGETDINVRLSLRQHPHVRLARQAQRWLNGRLQAAFDTHGTIPKRTIRDLDWPELPPGSESLEGQS